MGNNQDKEHGQEQDAPSQKTDTATEGQKAAEQDMPDNPEDPASD